MKRIAYILLSLMSMCALAMTPQDDNTAKKTTAPKAQPKLAAQEESIPDSLLDSRWKIKKTSAETYEDLDSLPIDLKTPANVQQEVIYNDSLNVYLIGSKMAGTYLTTPVIMSPEEYQTWSEQRTFNQYFRQKNAEEFAKKGKEKFDFSDMHFDLGPAEKIFGPGGVRIKTQGTAELRLGATFKNIDNPSLPIRNRKTKAFNFDEKINLNLSGKVGDKVNMNLNYNTDATFDFDTKNIKLRYEGKEDETIKLVEAGNVTFPSNSSLIKGASSLFGVRTDFQFGKLSLQAVLSQKNSSTKSVSSRGGTQMTPFEINAADYEENRHFFLSHYFRERYDRAMSTLPNLTTGVKITRVEIWVTNKTGTTSNTRNIVALTDLGESKYLVNPGLWGAAGDMAPRNAANALYSAMTTQYAAARDIDRTNTVLDGIPGFVGGVDYEKVQSARLLSSSEYSVNNALGYISLRTTLQTDQILAVAFEYTLNGNTYQVGEFASDNTNTAQAIFVKSLKNTNNSPQMGNWRLMMKNVYYLASSVEKAKFRLDVKYQSDTTGVYLSYIPEQQVKSTTLIKVLGADRLDNNNKPNPNGYFDFVEGYTVSGGRVFFPATEPFGNYLKDYLVRAGISADKADQYAFTELYDTTKTAAKQIAEKDKFVLSGQFKGTAANVISCGAYNVPQGSVVVTAGGVVLTEGSDYTVDYAAGEVTILNQSIIDAGTAVNVSLESNTDYGMQRKTMMGLNWEYDFSKELQFGGTFQSLHEQTLTSKVTMGSEPLNNILWGLHLNWKKESQWLTNMLDKLPGLQLTSPSQISFTGEFAHLVARQSSGTQDNASYIDDFENTKNGISVADPKSWILSSVPTLFSEHNDKSTLASGYNRARLAWYNIDPLFTYRSSSLTPGHIKSDLEQLSNHYVREVYVSELYPNRDQSTYNGATSTLSILNLAYYPTERGPYNFTTSLTPDGQLTNLSDKWGGMMRKLETNDFEAANIEYVEFWLLDPFIYTRETGEASSYGGDLYLNLGEVSEDVLRDGKKFYESGMPVDGTSSFTTTQWGKIPVQATQTYAFATTSGARAKQDVGFNGLTNEEEQSFDSYSPFRNVVATLANDSLREAWTKDPANDDYHYFRGSDFDRMQTPILERYKRINNPQGNSPDNDGNNESYDTSYKTTPDVEDINQDYTLNEYERYYQYKISIRPEDLTESNIGNNYLTDIREYTPTLRNGKKETIRWYKFRVPINSAMKERVGSINDFTSIRFMRMFLTNFSKPIVLRFGSLDLVRGEWRIYEQNLSTMATSNSGEMEVSAVNIEEYADKRPVNYVLPPGISRVTDPSQPQLVESNEQAMNITVKNLSKGEAKAVYKNTTLDLRQYKRLQMFVHANALLNNVTNLQNDQLAVFIRVGSDYKSNFYEYEIPLKLTPEREIPYSRSSYEDARLVWPQENMLDIDLSQFTAIKKARNKAKALGSASYNALFSEYDSEKPSNKISVMGNPSLGEIKTMVIGVRNISSGMKSGEVWINELRLLEFNNKGGWAASGALNMQLSDFGTVNVTGKYITEGFGGLEEGIAQRSNDDYKTYSFTANLELGKFFPSKAKVSIPFYYSITEEETRPRYNPLDTDMELDDALDAMDNHERDSIESIAVTKAKSTNFSLSNVNVDIKTKRHPMPYDPTNFSFSYSHSHRETSGETTVYENEDNWRGSLDYNYSPVYKTFEPFKSLKGKSKWLDFPKALGFNYLPQEIGFNTDILRNYYELQERDMESLEGSQLPLTFSEQFLWNREFSLRWDFTKNLRMNFQSATHAEIEEPYTPINKDLYPDQYAAWKDSVWHSIKNLGVPLDYQQSFQASYQLPLDKLPLFSWIKSDATYNATYSWVRGTELDDGTSLGNTITNNRTFNLNATFTMETLYNQVPFLKKANERFKAKQSNASQRNAAQARRNTTQASKTATTKDSKADAKQNAQLPANKNTFQQELTLLPDSQLTVTHGKKSKRLTVSARTKDGKPYNVKYKVLDDNKIVIKNLDTMSIKLSVTPKAPLEKQWWYNASQHLARGLMMVRTMSVAYRNQYSMTLPGFIPNVGDALGQRTGSVLSPGLDFAFGLTDDSYLNKAYDNGWLLCNDSVATPATSTSSEELRINMTLEPIADLKIDLNASHTTNKNNSIQFMYSGMPSTQNGSLNMTTISLKSALEGMGDANNGYASASFETFCRSIDGFRDRVQARYTNATYPQGTVDATGVNLSGSAYNPELGQVNKYSADVLIPAFLSAYTSSGGGLEIFPTLKRMLPNWTVRYGGLVRLPWIRDHFKSFNINHGYKSVFSIGSYASYSTYREYMDGLGFITDVTTGNPLPNSMYNVSTVSINESFAPLAGIDFTLNNDLSCKLEYRTTRVLSLSMTSVQLNESLSKDLVIGVGYKINNFRLFSSSASRKIKNSQRGGNSRQNQQSTARTQTATNSGVNHDLNLRCDFSFRRQAAITRDIATMTSAASSGNTAVKLSLMADYTLSRLLTLSAYFDHQSNTPLLSSSSYPTTTQDFGVSLKFSLTR